MALMASTTSNPSLVGGVKLEFLLQRIHKRLRHALPDAHRAVALHVGVAAHRAGARAGLADGPLHEVQVHDFLNRLHALALLRDAHGPAGNNFLLVGNEVGRFQQLGAADAADFLNFFPAGAADILLKLGETFREFSNELAVHHLAGVQVLGLKQVLHDAAQQGHVAVHLHLQENVGDLGAIAQQRAQRTSADS